VESGAGNDLLEEGDKLGPDWAKPSGANSIETVVFERRFESRVAQELLNGVGKVVGPGFDDKAGFVVVDEIGNTGKIYCDDGAAGCLSFRDGAVTVVGAGRGVENDIHSAVEVGQLVLVISGPVETWCQVESTRPRFELRLKLTVADDKNVELWIESGSCVKQ
jgi:hypothetical protein